MLRLLSDEDLAVVGNSAQNKKLLRKIRAERTSIFRGYLRCLARDYGNLLEGLRVCAVNSEVDRPDIAWAILRNKMFFAGALCRLDMLLFLRSFGVRGVDVSGLLEALDAMGAQTARAMSGPASFTA